MGVYGAGLVLGVRGVMGYGWIPSLGPRLAYGLDRITW